MLHNLLLINTDLYSNKNLVLDCFVGAHVCFSSIEYTFNIFLLLTVIPYICSMRPNIFLGVAEGSAQYKKWYFELVIDQVDHFVTGQSTHLRVGWANTRGYAPYPGGGEGWGGNGVGDDLYSYSFDGLHLWSGRIIRIVFQNQ